MHPALRTITLYLPLALTILLAYSLSYTTPFRRPFRLDDASISYPKLKGTIPNSALICLSTLFPALTILGVTCIQRAAGGGGGGGGAGIAGWTRALRRPGLLFWRRLNARIYSLGIAIAMTMLVTDSVKNVAGRPRPDFLARCGVKIGEERWGDWTECEGDEWRDGFRSFPSGHASITFAGSTYLTLVLLPLLTLPYTPSIRRPATTTASTSLLARHPYLTLLALFPLVSAATVAATRLGDNRHHPLDVVVGTGIGVVFGFVGNCVRREMEGEMGGEVGLAEEVDEVGESDMESGVVEGSEGVSVRREEGRKYSIAEERAL